MLTIRLHSSDNVVVALDEISPGTAISEEGIVCRKHIPGGHKVAAVAIEKREPIRKYGEIIGFASDRIEPGEHVHTHNVVMADFDRDGAEADRPSGARSANLEIQETFNGIVRPDGRVATRNYVGVLSTVNCSASVARHIADPFRAAPLKDFPNVDGVVALCHGGGCTMAEGGEGLACLQRTVAGYARHPNFAGLLIIGLGCESNNIDSLVSNTGLETSPLLQVMSIQEVGGTSGTVRQGRARIREMLEAANRVIRRPVPVGDLIVGLECGGSDAYSGFTANPALGNAMDHLIRHGGTAVLSETPEIYGAEHLLAQRSRSSEVRERFLALFPWWEDYAARNDATLDNNPSPGNKAGGLTTILEKSLGAVAKGGSTNLMAVYRYAEPIRSRGLVFMDTPGYDPASITGMVAGGANMVCFTTGRGSIFGCKPVPVIKLASNTPLYRRMGGDMDIDCGVISDGEATLEELGERIFRFILETASGKKTKSETHGIGDDEFVPWLLGAVL
jgi:altronate hydrolase